MYMAVFLLRSKDYATRAVLSFRALEVGVLPWCQDCQQSVARGSAWPHYLRTGTLKTGNRMVRLIVEQVLVAISWSRTKSESRIR